MTMPSERRISASLWRDLFAIGSLTDANRFLSRIELARSAQDRELMWPLWIAFTVSYSKPFTNNTDMGPISEKAIPSDLKYLHKAFTEARDIVYGHTDPLKTLQEGFQANEIHIMKNEHGIDVVPMAIAPLDNEIPNAKRLVASLLRDLNDRTLDGRGKLFAELKGKPNGNYAFPYPKPPEISSKPRSGPSQTAG